MLHHSDACGPAAADLPPLPLPPLRQTPTCLVGRAQQGGGAAEEGLHAGGVHHAVALALLDGGACRDGGREGQWAWHSWCTGRGRASAWGAFTLMQAG